MISRIIKVSIRVISFSLRLWLTTPTSTLIILDITKTSSNNCLKRCFEIFHHLQKSKARIFLYFRKFSFRTFSKTPSLDSFCYFMKEIIMHHPLSLRNEMLLRQILSNLNQSVWFAVSGCSVTRCWQYIIIKSFILTSLIVY